MSVATVNCLQQTCLETHRHCVIYMNEWMFNDTPAQNKSAIGRQTNGNLKANMYISKLKFLKVIVNNNIVVWIYFKWLTTRTTNCRMHTINISHSNA